MQQSEAITGVFGPAEAVLGELESGGENLAQRPVYGDVIILQVGVNEEADLQIFHMRITANYWIIPEASVLTPLWPSPHLEHTNGKK